MVVTRGAKILSNLLVCQPGKKTIHGHILLPWGRVWLVETGGRNVHWR